MNPYHTLYICLSSIFLLLFIWNVGMPKIALCLPYNIKQSPKKEKKKKEETSVSKGFQI